MSTKVLMKSNVPFTSGDSRAESVIRPLSSRLANVQVEYNAPLPTKRAVAVRAFAPGVENEPNAAVRLTNEKFPCSFN